MRLAPLIAATVATVCCNLSSLAQTVTIRPDVRHQTIEGWGTSMAGWDAANTPYGDARWKNAYRDLGLNILRVPMEKGVLLDPSGDMTIPVTLGSDMGANLSKFNFNTGGMPTYGSMAQWLKTNALEPGRVKVVASSWSPPHWMKGPTCATQSWVGDPAQRQYATPWLSGQHNPWGPNYNGGDSIGGRLKTEDPATAQQYGRYMASWVKGFEQTYGVPLDSISLQNESTFENPFDSMVLNVGPDGQTDHTQYAKALKGVKDAWQELGLNTRVSGPHVANVGPDSSNPYGLDAQMRMIQGVKDHSDPDLIKFLHAYNAHYYMGTGEGAVRATAGYFQGKQAIGGTWGNNNYAYVPGVKNDGKPIYYSETGGEEAYWLQSAANPGNGSIATALKMYNALVFSNASQYIYWQLSDGSANVTEHNLLGTSQLDDPHQSQKYSAFKHFSRFVRPGAIRIDASFENDRPTIGGSSQYDTDSALNVAAFLHEADGTFTLVLINTNGAATQTTLDLPASLGITALDVYRTSENESFATLADLIPTDNRVTIDVPAFSVMTLYGTLAAPVPEPASLTLVGAASLFLLRRRHRGFHPRQLTNARAALAT